MTATAGSLSVNRILETECDPKCERSGLSQLQCALAVFEAEGESGGHPISCETALVALRHLDEGLIAPAAQAGDRLMGALKRSADRSPLIGEVRGKGLMVGVDIVTERVRQTTALEARNRIIQRCFEKGLLLVGAGRHVVRFLPALVVTDQQIDQAVTLFTDAVMEVDRELPHAA